MKVLHVTNLYPTSENPTYGIFVKEQIESLNNANLMDVFYINAKENGWKEYVKSIRVLRNIVPEYDIIHCHHQFSLIPVFFSNPKAKIILSVLGDISKRDLLNKLVFHFSKLVSQRVILKNRLIYSTKKYILLPNGVNLNFFKPIDKKSSKNFLGLSLDQNYVLFVSNSRKENPIKRKDKFVEVLKAVNQKGSKKFKPLFMSGVERSMVLYYFNAVDFMILTSDHEGSPNAVKEAMACNTPIVSTAVGDVQRLLNGVLNSFVSEKGNVMELTDLVLQLDTCARSNGREKLKQLGLDSNSVGTLLTDQYKLLI